MQLPDNIEPYRKPIAEILSWMPDWLHQNEFDRLAYKRRPTSLTLISYRGDTPILLAGVFHGHQQGALQLLKIMEYEGLVERKTDEKGFIYYRAKQCSQ